MSASSESPRPDDRGAPADPVTPDAVAAVRPGWRRRAWRITRVVLIAGGGLLVLAAMAWGLLLTLILPRVDGWRDALAQQATRALGLTVKIGAVQGWREGLWPVLALRDVQFVDAQGRAGLRLPEVRARIAITTLSPRALADGELRLAELALVRPELDVRRDRDGHISVAGFALPDHPAGGDEAERGLDWVLSQARIRIEQGTVRWTDASLDAPPLALADVDLQLDNRSGLGRRVHKLRVAATPPAGFGRRFDLVTTQTQPLWQIGERPQAEGLDRPWWQRWDLTATRASQWATWSGDVQVNLPWVDVQQLRRHVRLPVDVQGGQGRLEAHLQWQQGQPQALKLQGALQAVAVRLAPELEPLVFKRLEGSVSVNHQREQSQLSVQDLAFELTEGLVWPRSSGSLLWRHAPWPGRTPADTGLSADVWRLTRGGDAQADHLDLDLLARIADRLPLAASVRQALADLAPKGVITQAVWRWDGPPDAPIRYLASGELAGLALAPSQTEQRPGLMGASGRFEATEAGGHADLRVQAGWLAFPGVFEQPQVPLDQLSARVNWQIKAAQGQMPAQWRVDVSQASFANADATGVLEGHWQTAGWAQPARERLPGRLKLTGRLDKAQAAAVWRYLPMTLPASARSYVRDAVQGGQADKVVFDVDGDLTAFPFPEDKGGRFRVKAPVSRVRLDYVPARLLSDHGETPTATWPAFTELEGQLIFEGQRLIIRDARGKLGTVGTGTFAMHDVEGRINDLGAQDPHLTVRGQGEGQVEDMLKFLTQSPIGVWTGQVMQPARGQGTGDMKLALDIPLDHAGDTRVQGDVQLPEDGEVSLRLQPGLPAFHQLSGRVSFTESELKIRARGQVWGNTMEITGQRSPNGHIRFDAQGMVAAASLSEAREFGVLPILAQRLTGESPVHVSVSMIPDAQGHLPGGPTVVVQSSLQGIAANWPAPLNKPAAAGWPLKVVYRPDDPQGHHDAISVDLGQASATTPQLQVEVRRDVSGAHAHFQRGSIQLWQGSMSSPSALTLPASGMSAQVQLPLLDVDAWLPVVRQVQADASQAPSDGGESAEVYLPRSIAIKAASLQLRQRSLKDVAGTLSHPSADVWRAQLEAAQVAGQVEWTPDASGLGPKLVARLSRLAIPHADAQALEDQAAEQLTGGSAGGATRLPAVDIVVDQFEWRGMALGKLEIEASNQAMATDAAPEWRLKRFQMSTPDARLQASGQWGLPGSAAARALGHASALSRSSFQFDLDIANGGALLTRLGLAKTIDGSKGHLTGQISWQGSPLEPDPLTMTGDIKIQISEGQFLKVDPGMAKLLGVLSLQSLPRRLTLDFRDVFEKGFAFDAIDGDVSVGQGAARTRNLRMRGVTALVLMEGEADLAHETQDLHVYVIPEINAGSASLAYAAINPVIGLGTFLAQMLLRKQVAEVGTREFRVTGPWSDPSVVRVESKESGKDAAQEPAKPPVATSR